MKKVSIIDWWIREGHTDLENEVWEEITVDLKSEEGPINIDWLKDLIEFAEHSCDFDRYYKLKETKRELKRQNG